MLHQLASTVNNKDNIWISKNYITLIILKSLNQYKFMDLLRYSINTTVYYLYI
jgi:hypothetical protein